MPGPRPSRSRAATFLLLSVVLAACSSGPELRFEDASALVLQPEDVPSPLVSFAEGPSGGSRRVGDAPASGSRGWIARYRNPDPAAESGALVIESRAEVLPDADAAENVLSELRQDYQGKELPSPALGESAWAVSFTQPSLGSDLTYTATGWREENVVASLVVQAREGKLSPEEVFELAQIQDNRIRRALAA